MASQGRGTTKQQFNHQFVKMASCQENALRFFTGLRGFHVYRSSWKPYVQQKIELRKENHNKHDKYAVAGCTKLPGKLGLCVVGHTPREISRYIWFALAGDAAMSARVVSTAVKRSPLIQGGLEIEIEVFVQWVNNDTNLKILEDKIKSVNFPLGEPYKDDTDAILKLIKEEEEAVCILSEDEEEEEEEEQEVGSDFRNI